MFKIAIDAGHGMNTPGKRTPSGEREWSFNNKVAVAVIAKLNMYQNVQILRLDDATGKTDIPLKTRTDRANAWKADVLVSCHHNAYTGKWGSHGGVETYTFSGASQNSRDVATLIHPLVVKAMGLRDRGRKSMNLHMLRESKMPAILVEGGFMDSTTDIGAIRNDLRLKMQGEGIGQGLAAYFNLKLKVNSSTLPASTVYQYRDKGSVIGSLQKKLNRLGYQLVVDNIFGPAVLAAVKDFQKKNGLAVDGKVGPLTQAKITALLVSKSNLYRVIVGGKQVGAYENSENIITEIENTIKSGATKIEIQKV